MLKGNVGQYGFYRVNYDSQGWTDIIKQMNKNHRVCMNHKPFFSVRFLLDFIGYWGVVYKCVVSYLAFADLGRVEAQSPKYNSKPLPKIKNQTIQYVLCFS